MLQLKKSMSFGETCRARSWSVSGRAKCRSTLLNVYQVLTLLVYIFEESFDELMILQASVSSMQVAVFGLTTRMKSMNDDARAELSPTLLEAIC